MGQSELFGLGQRGCVVFCIVCGFVSLAGAGEGVGGEVRVVSNKRTAAPTAARVEASV